jgi:hypothetical protein
MCHDPAPPTYRLRDLHSRGSRRRANPPNPRHQPSLKAPISASAPPQPTPSPQVSALHTPDPRPGDQSQVQFRPQFAAVRRVACPPSGPAARSWPSHRRPILDQRFHAVQGHGACSGTRRMSQQDRLAPRRCCGESATMPWVTAGAARRRAPQICPRRSIWLSEPSARRERRLVRLRGRCWP